MKKPKRKYLMVDMDFHKKMFLKIFFISFLGLLFMVISIYFLANEEVERTFFSIHQGVRNTWNVLLPAVFLGGGASLIFSVLAIYYFTLIQAHRLGGPLYHILRSVEELKKGNLSVDFSVREKDYLQDLATALQEVVRENSERINSLKREVELVRSRMAEIENSLEEKGISYIMAEDIDALNTALTNIDAEIRTFRTKE